MTLALSKAYFFPLQNISKNSFQETSNVVFIALQKLWKGSESTFSLKYALIDEALGKKILDLVNEGLKCIDFSDLFIEVGKGIVVQAAFYALAKQIVSDKDLVIFFCNITLAALVSIIASTILFNLVSLANGVDLVSAVASTVIGITIGILQCHYGLTTEALIHKVKDLYFQNKNALS